jgi:squalene cyclase
MVDRNWLQIAAAAFKAVAQQDKVVWGRKRVEGWVPADDEGSVVRGIALCYPTDGETDRVWEGEGEFDGCLNFD